MLSDRYERKKQNARETTKKLMKSKERKMKVRKREAERERERGSVRQLYREVQG